MRSAVEGCVDSSAVIQRGGSRSATFCSAIVRSKDTNASARRSARASSCRRGARAPGRGGCRSARPGAETIPAASASAGNAAGVPRSGDSAPAQPLHRERGGRRHERRVERRLAARRAGGRGRARGRPRPGPRRGCSGRAACRTGPPAWSARARSRRRWPRWCGGWRRRSTPRPPSRRRRRPARARPRASRPRPAG